MEEYGLLILVLIFLASILAGFIDSMVGGGGLISVPTLMLLNIPPKMVLGTNKFQSTFGSFTAAYFYVKHNLASIKVAKWGIIFTLFGAISGTLLVSYLSNKFLSQIIPFALIALALFMFVNKSLGIKQQNKKLDLLPTFILLGLLLGFYDGFFGPGTGNFWTIGLVVLQGMELKTATAYTKIMNFTSNLVALMIFISSGLVIYKIGFIMGIGQFLGARIGSKVVINNQSKIIRPIFIGVVLLLSIYLLYKQFFL